MKWSLGENALIFQYSLSTNLLRKCTEISQEDLDVLSPWTIKW